MSTEWRAKKRGDRYYAVRSVDGATVRRSLGTTDRKAADILCKRWNREEADPSLVAGRELTFGQAVTDFVNANKLRKLSDATRDEYYPPKLKALTGYFGEQMSVVEFTTDRIAGFVEKRLRECSPHNTGKELDTLRLILQLAWRAEAFPKDPRLVLPWKFNKDARPRQTALTKPQAEALIGALEPVRRAYVCFILATSARRKEAGLVRREDIVREGDNWTVHIRGTKTKRSNRFVPVEGWALPLLECALRDAPGADELFPSAATWKWPYAALRKAASQAGVPYASPSDLRRTYATWLVDDGGNPFIIKDAMGHKDISMLSDVYAKVTTETLRRELKRIGDPSLAQVPGDYVDSMDDTINVTEAQIMEELVGPAGIEPATNGLKAQVVGDKTHGKKRNGGGHDPSLAQVRTRILIRRATAAAMAGDEARTLAIMDEIRRLGVTS